MVVRALWILAAAAAGVSCDAPLRTRECPASTTLDADRAATILRGLHAAAREPILALGLRRSLAEALGSSDVVLCFGASASALIEDGPIVLDRSLTDAALSARLGHLLLHRTHAVPWTAEDRGHCANRVAKAMRAEAVGLAAELELRRVLGAGDVFATSDLEREFFRAPQADRVGVAERYLVAHPDGVAGVGASIASYRARCRREGS